MPLDRLQAAMDARFEVMSLMAGHVVPGGMLGLPAKPAPEPGEQMSVDDKIARAFNAFADEDAR